MTIPASVLSISQYAFTYSEVKTVIFSSPNTSIEIQDLAFLDCEQLISIVLPIKNVIMNFENAFTNCTKLTKVYYPMTNYPTNRKDIGTRKVRFFARIESKPDSEQTQGQSQKINHCGDVEIDAYKYLCRIKRNTLKRSNNCFSNILRYSLSVILMC